MPWSNGRVTVDYSGRGRFDVVETICLECPLSFKCECVVAFAAYFMQQALHPTRRRAGRGELNRSRLPSENSEWFTYKPLPSSTVRSPETRRGGRRGRTFRWRRRRALPG